MEETGEFGVNIVSLPRSNTMHGSAKKHLPEADEFKRAGLTPVLCEVVGASWVGEALHAHAGLPDRVLSLGTDHLV